MIFWSDHEIKMRRNVVFTVNLRLRYHKIKKNVCLRVTAITLEKSFLENVVLKR